MAIIVLVDRGERDGGVSGDHVTDNGCGIPEAVLTQLEHVTTKDHGNGLGLAASRRIVADGAGTSA